MIFTFYRNTTAPTWGYVGLESTTTARRLRYTSTRLLSRGTRCTSERRSKVLVNEVFLSGILDNLRTSQLCPASARVTNRLTGLRQTCTVEDRDSSATSTASRESTVSRGDGHAKNFNNPILQTFLYF